MRIAFLSFDFPEYCIRHANEMAREHDVLLMLPENHLNGLASLLAPAVHFEPFHKSRFRQPIGQLRAITTIFRSLAKFRPDVVHFQHGHLYFNAVLPLIRRYPLVVTIHDPRQHIGDKDSQKVPQWLMDFGFRRADRNIVHGRELIDTVQRLIGIPKERIHYIPHIAIGEPVAAPVKATTLEVPKVLFFGRIWEYKGLDYLIKAEPLITARFPNAKIVIGGQGEDFERYRQLMVHPDRFEVHNGWIDEELSGQLFNEATVVVLPYVEATQSGVVPLAYNHSKPVVATRVGALPEAVEHGVTGWLVPPRNVEELAEAIIRLLESPETCAAMGQAGQAKLRRECEPAVVVPQTLEVYRLAIAGRRSPVKHKHSQSTAGV